MLWIAVAVLGCVKPQETTDNTDDTTTTTTTPTGTTGDTAIVHTGLTDTGPGTGHTGDTAAPVDCSVLPTLPVSYTTMYGFNTSEDFDIDGDGYLCSVTSGTLACKDMYGNIKIIAPGVVGGSAGTRILPTGDWVIANTAAQTLVLVDGVTGGSSVVASGMEYPNGVEVDEYNYAYVAEQNAGRVRQIDVYNGTQTIVATGLVNPNGVILSPDGNTLYVGSFGGGVVYAIDRISTTEWDLPRILFDPAGPDGGFDGINVDICGNVYITEYIAGRVYRILPDGSAAEVVVDLPSGWIPNMRWGHGMYGWETDILYVTAWDRIYALDMGIDGKKHVLAP